jgi:tetratricopeptide (TPR) repeat protein
MKDGVRVSVKFFLKTYGWDKGAYYLTESTKAILEGKDSITIPKDDYEEALEIIKEGKRKEELLMRTSKLNSRGAALEKEGRIDEAIQVYEKNIEGEYPACNSYDRLMILYRKRKQYEDEIRVINKAINVFSDAKHFDIVDKYISRLDRAMELYKRTLI